MRTRTVAALTLAIATSASCSTRKRSLDLDADTRASSTSVYGHWVLATPADSTGFTGASQVELVLAPGTFTISAAYPDRPPLTVTGRAELAGGGLLTLVPADGSTGSAAVGLASGQPFTRVASASGATLLLAPPSSRVPLPSSVWHRSDAPRVAGAAPG